MTQSPLWPRFSARSGSRWGCWSQNLCQVDKTATETPVARLQVNLIFPA